MSNSASGSAIAVTKAAFRPWRSCHGAYCSADLHFALHVPGTAHALLGSRVESSDHNKINTFPLPSHADLVDVSKAQPVKRRISRIPSTASDRRCLVGRCGWNALLQRTTRHVNASPTDQPGVLNSPVSLFGVGWSRFLWLR